MLLVIAVAHEEFSHMTREDIAGYFKPELRRRFLLISKASWTVRIILHRIISTGDFKKAPVYGI